MDNENNYISKTQVKKQLNDLQKLGLKLTNFSNEQLNKINIPKYLIDEILIYKKITSNRALKRQAQYIGKLVRELEEQYINNIKIFIDIVEGNNEAYIAKLKRVELIREKILIEDDFLTEYINENNHLNIDIAELRTLINNVKKEKQQDKPLKSFNKLYKYLKNIEDKKELNNN